MKRHPENNYTRFKRKIYLIIFPLIVLTNVFYWLFSPFVDPSLDIILPLYSIFMLTMWLLIFLNRYFRLCEIISLIVFTAYHLYRVHSMTLEFESGALSVYVFWSTMLFIFVFLILNRKQAFVYSLTIFVITMIIGMPHFSGAKVNDTLIQYYISTFIYILILFYFHKLVLAYLESDVLRKNAYYDALTGIGNRRLIDSWLNLAIKQARQSKHAFSIIYFDIDYFKAINDTYGHDAGDHVLREFSKIVNQHIQPIEFFGRWGGEEFIIILKNKPMSEATEFAENLRQQIERHTFPYVKQLTSSFGVTSFRIDDGPQTLLKRVDRALYLAKQLGRNNVQTL